MYNIICGIFFLFIVFLSLLLGKIKYGKLVMQILACALLVYKTYIFASYYADGLTFVPIEISTISYFLVAITLIFSIKKFYIISSFFGIISGLGFYVFYIILGFKMPSIMPLNEVIIGSLCHGYLLLAGLYLFKNNTFEKSEKTKLWISIFAMLTWSLSFYDKGLYGTKFIFYIIKPDFLYVFSIPVLNILMQVLYFALLTLIYSQVIRLFIFLNHKVTLKNAEVISKSKVESEEEKQK